MTFTKTAWVFTSYAHQNGTHIVSEQEHTLSAINDAILCDNSLSDEHKTALIELMRVAYETVTRLS